ncbi:MAG: hypothetical protein M1833_006360 [Piccolia ochrophora]|nr:MAG: hypothetical protein M1833_006360 [Piccolia ochrophora]
MAPDAFGQTVAVFDKSGKVISTSKTLFAVFNEAKAAYKERKAELLARRRTDGDVTQVRRALKSFTFDEGGSVTSSRHSHQSKSRSRPRHKSRHHSESNTRALHREPSLTGDGSPSELHRQGLVRRHTTKEDQRVTLCEVPSRSPSIHDSQIDMDLAYGDEIPSPPSPLPRAAKATELTGLMSKANFLLDEAHCVQHSVTKMIASLQKNPEALAAVALTLAEISNVVSKMGPGALTAMRVSFPRVVALLCSPQFMIAAGLGVGVLVVALGGYKVVQKLQARNSEADDMAELQEIGGDVNRIDAWRRGVTEIGDDSVGTSVDGEFITPEAAAMTWRPRDGFGNEVIIEEDEGAPSEATTRKTKKHRPSGSRRASEMSRTEKSERKRGGEKRHGKKKETSALQLLFR